MRPVSSASLVRASCCSRAARAASARSRPRLASAAANRSRASRSLSSAAPAAERASASSAARSSACAAAQEDKHGPGSRQAGVIGGRRAQADQPVADRVQGAAGLRRLGLDRSVRVLGRLGLPARGVESGRRRPDGIVQPPARPQRHCDLCQCGFDGDPAPAVAPTRPRPESATCHGGQAAGQRPGQQGGQRLQVPGALAGQRFQAGGGLRLRRRGRGSALAGHVGGRGGLVETFLRLLDGQLRPGAPGAR